MKAMVSPVDVGEGLRKRMGRMPNTIFVSKFNFRLDLGEGRHSQRKWVLFVCLFVSLFFLCGFVVVVVCSYEPQEPLSLPLHCSGGIWSTVSYK